MVIFKKVATGIFEVFHNDVKTNYGIINGCLGASGFGNNLYGITNSETGKTNWLGSLQACKKSLTHHFNKIEKQNG
jgi:hypothetical protein